MFLVNPDVLYLGRGQSVDPLHNLSHREVFDACSHGGGHLDSLRCSILMPLFQIIEVVPGDPAGADGHRVSAVVDCVVDGLLVSEGGPDQHEIVILLGDSSEHLAKFR